MVLFNGGWISKCLHSILYIQDYIPGALAALDSRWVCGHRTRPGVDTMLQYCPNSDMGNFNTMAMLPSLFINHLKNCAFETVLNEKHLA